MEINTLKNSIHSSHSTGVNVVVFSLDENVPVFTGVLTFEKEENAGAFYIKIFDAGQFVVSDNMQKKIVILNEIFTINFVDYVVYDQNSPTHILTSTKGEKDWFSHLSQRSFFSFLSSIFKNMFYFKFHAHKKNKIAFFYALSLSFLFLFILFNKAIMNEEISQSEKTKTQRNIYLQYQQIVKNSVLDQDKKIAPIMLPKLLRSEKSSQKTTPILKPLKKTRKKPQQFLQESELEVDYFLFKK